MTGVVSPIKYSTFSSKYGDFSSPGVTLVKAGSTGDNCSGGRHGHWVLKVVSNTSTKIVLSEHVCCSFNMTSAPSYFGIIDMCSL